ncbi:preprotein translocase subunit SecY [Simonsiella muelleri]|uniref:Protein translocase subunit SecY n=1 Tax=Simonsiella muelleri ATCC 29453 TaxID=641147 RepID=V9HKQ0_9NEIS|nr:preprotein translocase subunit SecY [Simonsiella muelleri]AUX62387.1 preprotein translocase subunit SecY [Simonsiella muelleri ATCC 29453]EFG30642.1 preprotein translocase, SecY subunit [Simonsiella muelleri ATCC 29453]UBQ52886.1 preprotein translocase subunit SecY [Simonsiella muelleri]
MANQLSSSGKANLWSNPDLRKRIVFLLGALIIFRIGAHVPVPGVDAAALAKLYQNVAGSGILGMLNMFSGGSLERFSIFAIGIMPYISASIVMQLAGEIVPSLKALKKEGDTGRKIITKYTRVGTVFLATIQSFFAATLVYNQGIVVVGHFEFITSAVACIVGGTMFLMWLGEQITERGIGNGISLIITAGIIAGIPRAVGQLWSLMSTSPLQAIALAVGALVLVYAVVCFESALRKVPIHYAKRQVMQAQNTHLPFKLNMAGVIPPIFASSVIMFPSMFASWLGSKDSSGWLSKIAVQLQHGSYTYMALFAVTIIFFCYFYTALAFSPKEMAENLKKSGAFVPSIRPGVQTSRYLEKVVLRLTFFGALYITTVCLIPEILTTAFNIPFALGGTSLLILVVVTIDFNTQIASYRVSQQYDSYMVRRSDAKSSTQK